MRNKADNKIKQEKEEAKREFEAALIYEQMEAARRNKKASEEGELVQAVDALYSAAARYENIVKTAGLEKSVIGVAGLLALLAGHSGFTGGYARKQEEIKQKEKEKMLGHSPDIPNVLKNLEAKNVAQAPVALSMNKSPGFGGLP
jgi:hypothetical protein